MTYGEARVSTCRKSGRLMLQTYGAEFVTGGPLAVPRVRHLPQRSYHLTSQDLIVLSTTMVNDGGQRVRKQVARVASPSRHGLVF